MSEYFGFKKIYGFGLLLTGFLCFLSPVLSKLNVWAFILLRVFQGIFEGVTFPSLYVMTARWIPLKERNTFIARSFFGTVFGLIITFPLCGFLADAFGWESAFYVIGNSTICDNYTMTTPANTIVYALGCITVVWFVFWWFLVFDTPDKHPRISHEELEYINSELTNTLNEKPKPIPWMSIFKSVPFWGMVITDMGNCVGIITLGSYGPTYLKSMLNVDIKTNGVLSGLPMLSRYVGGLLWGAIGKMFFMGYQ